MKTTETVIELLMTGVGALIWITLLIAWKTGNNAEILSFLFSTSSIPIVLGIMYISGIIIDRLADDILSSIIENRLKERYFNEPSEYHTYKAKIRYKSEGLNQFLEYQKMKIRVIRGTVFNLFFIVVFSFLYFKNSAYSSHLSFIMGFVLVSFVASIYSFIRTIIVHYERVIDFHKTVDLYDN